MIPPLVDSNVSSGSVLTMGQGRPMGPTNLTPDNAWHNSYDESRLVEMAFMVLKVNDVGPRGLMGMSLSMGPHWTCL